MSSFDRSINLPWLDTKRLSTRDRVLDRTAFAELYATYLPKVLNYVSYRIADPYVVEDLTSTVFEQALTHLDTYRVDKGAFSTWLFTIAHNTVATFFRKTQRQPLLTSLDALPEIMVKGASPEQAVLEAEQFRQLQSLIHKLPEREQEILALKFGSEMSNQDIARVLGLKPVHVGVLAYRAVQKLRQAVEKGV